MSFLLIASFAILTFVLISQFGGKLTARNSLVWWLIFLFLAWGVISPHSLEPVAHLLGIQLVSNFVLATMILFLAFQAIQESAFTTSQSRKLRDLISSLAAEAFAAKFLGLGASLEVALSDAATNAHPATKRIKVLIGMPCYNEAEYLPTLSEEISAFLTANAHGEFDYHFCIVNDGSTDRTRFILDEKFPGSSIHHLSNVGVAGAVLTAFKSAELIGAEFVVQCDSDGQHPLVAIPKLVRAAKHSGADLMIGSRYTKDLGPPKTQAQAINQDSREAIARKDTSSTVSRRAGSRLIAFTLHILFGRNEITDPTSGLRLYSKKAQHQLLKLMPDEYPEPETIAILLGKKMRVGEISVHMAPRQGGVSSLSGGVTGARFMIKVLSALIGLRLRTLVSKG
jgi:hypothetical protein